MPHPSHTQYLVSKIQTASQPQLHLLLLNGAVRFVRQALEATQDPSKPPEEAERLLDKAIDIVEAMVRSVSGRKIEISKQLEEQYAYMFRELVACRFNRDAEKLSVILKMLEYERETWQHACKLCQQGDASSDRSASIRVNAPAERPVSAPLYLNTSDAMSDGISLEA